MAGIRPQARGSAFTGIHVALVVFVVLWLASTIGLVILYTGQTKLAQDRDAALADLERVANRGQLAQYQSLARPGQTVLGRMADERSSMSKSITGTEGDEWTAIRRQITDRYAAIQSSQRLEPTLAAAFSPDAEMPLLKAVDTLVGSLARERQQRQQLEQQLQAAQSNIASLTAARDQARQQFEQNVAGLAAQLEQTRGQLASYQQDKDEELKLLEASASRAKEQLSKQTERHNAQMQELDASQTKMRDRLNDALTTLKQLRGQPDVYAAARQADGMVIRALPGNPYVYVNLGAKDQVTLGMTFAVYSPSQGVPTSGEGKATIEITSVYDDVSAGRIVSRNRDQPVLEGDLIANAVYSKGRKHKFVVVGRFDMDGDGVATTDAAERIESMIREWGGQVVDDLDTTTDFVVVGQGPMQPVAPPANASPIDKQRYQENMQKYQAFQDVIKEAKDLMVPILNQTQFLHYVGYNLNALRGGNASAAR